MNFTSAEFGMLNQHQRATELRFLEHADLFEETALIVGVTDAGNGQVDLVFDRSIFYPKGGGQAADVGSITLKGDRLPVVGVSLDTEGRIHHSCIWGAGLLPDAGDIAQLNVEKSLRVLHSRSHSAGHLIDIALQLTESPLRPMKANHAPGDSWIKFDARGVLLSTDALGNLGGQLSSQIARIRVQNPAIFAETLDSVTAEVRGFSAPAGKLPRVVTFAGYEQFSRGCGGTHVSSVDKIGEVAISRLSLKKGVLTVNYRLLD